MNVSIIIPTYNEKENIVVLTDQLIDIFNNSSHNLKIIVVDDNSPDGTSSIVEQLNNLLYNAFLTYFFKLYIVFFLYSNMNYRYEKMVFD